MQRVYILFILILYSPGCGSNFVTYSKSSSIDELLRLNPGESEQSVIEKLGEPLYQMTSAQVTEKAAKQGRVRALGGEKAWYYASDSTGWYFVIFDKNEVVYAGGPVDGDLHLYMDGDGKRGTEKEGTKKGTVPGGRKGRKKRKKRGQTPLIGQNKASGAEY